jgi:nicotinamidase-related amidase
MPTRSPDLHGNVPESSNTALLLIDVINDLDFKGGDKLLKAAQPMARNLARLKARAHRAGIPAVYVNDNFGRWTSDFRALISHCLEDDSRGRTIAQTLAPAEGDYFVLKPKHSGFFSTTLELVLKYIGASRLILTGLTTDICVLFTANDAFMREFKLLVPSDCVASANTQDHRIALQYMKRVLEADTRKSSSLDLVKNNSK